MRQGILYLAFGQKYREEVYQSASRVSELGDWPICVITNENRFPDDNIFDEIKISDPDADWKGTEFGEDIKSTYFRKSPFERTLFLDSDTYVVDHNAIDELFELLNEYDIAAALDAARTGEQGFGDIQEGIPDYPTPTEAFPDSFPWLNIGVLPFRKSARMDKFFNNWNQRFNEQNEILKGVNDQSSFAETLFRSDLTHTVLPPEYNHHVPYPQVNLGPVKIVHGHFANLPEIAESLNSTVSEENPHPFRVVRYQTEMKEDELIARPEIVPGLADRPK